jgi:hypothetical protein
MFQIKVVDKIKTRILYSVTFFPDRENIVKYGGAREDAGNMALARGILDK